MTKMKHRPFRVIESLPHLLWRSTLWSPNTFPSIYLEVALSASGKQSLSLSNGASLSSGPPNAKNSFQMPLCCRTLQANAGKTVPWHLCPLDAVVSHRLIFSGAGSTLLYLPATNPKGAFALKMQHVAPHSCGKPSLF